MKYRKLLVGLAGVGEDYLQRWEGGHGAGQSTHLQGGRLLGASDGASNITPPDACVC